MKNIILFSLLSFVTAAHAQQVVFSVGNTKVTLDEFKKRLAEYKSSTFNPPTAEQLLEDWVRFEIGVQEAEKEKMQTDPAVKERYRQVLYNALLEKNLGKKIESIPITESDMKEYYRHSPEIRLSHIFIEYPVKATPEQHEIARKRAFEIYDNVKKELKNKRPFEDLVKLYSDDLSTKDNGGDMGYQSRVTVPFYDSIVKLKAGEVTAPIESRQGFHIIKVTGRNTYENADKRQIRAAVFDEKRAKIFTDYFDRLKRQYSVRVNREVMKAAQQ
jgi:peptidyl-prolyl cis-trans isomerase C/peptidyl-prolyl cis-trans isomerase D